MGVRPTSIAHLLNEIRDGDIVLPDLQREFVWKPDQMRLLFDSIMQGYPFGSLLLWETRFLNVYYRDFVRDAQERMTFIPKLKEAGKPKRMVLDGQQRLQSLYLGIYGSLEGRQLYFDISSGPESKMNDNEGEGEGEGGDEQLGKFRFAFWRNEEQSNRPSRFVRVCEIADWSPRIEDDQIKSAIDMIPLHGTEADRAARNIRLLRQAINRADLVPVETIDEEVRNAEQARRIEEILDIFVRVNQGGTRLTQSDLMFSLIKTKWVGARKAFDDLENEVDPDGKLGVDKDFLIRGLLVVSDAPVAFDVETIGRHWDAMQPMFDKFAAALRSAIDFCHDPDVGFYSTSLLQPPATLYPIIYYLSRQKNCSVPDAERHSLRTVLYFLLFNGFLRGKSPQARVRWLRENLVNVGGGPFPVDNILAVVKNKQKEHHIQTDEDMLNSNHELALNIVQPKVCRESLSWQAKAEVDHIFPQSVYRQRYPELVDDIGNLAYLGKLRNMRKNDDMPWDYFKQIPDDVELERDFLVQRSLLADEKFEEFVRVRRARIVDVVRQSLGR